MGGEHTTATHCLRILLLNDPAHVAAQLQFHQADGQQRRMTFIHVVDVDVVIQGFENAHTTDSQNGFLAQAVIRIATIEMIGKLSIACVILRQVRVQQVNRDGVPADSFEIVAPRPDHYGTILDSYLDHGVFEDEKFFQGPGLVRGGLNAVCIEMLLEVPLAMQQGDRAKSSPRSAADRMVSPASTPSPPL